MNSYYLNKLEYNKILEILSNFCTTFIGKRLCLELLPSNDKNKVKQLELIPDKKGNLIIS